MNKEHKDINRYIDKMLSTNEMEKLLVRFPKIELSYDKLIHKKVHSDFYQAIPYGKKYFAWFTWHKDENVCVFLETDYSLKIYDMFIAPVCFNDELSYNTIVYGTILPKSKRFFVIEDIFYYKNKNIGHYNNLNKIKQLHKLMTKDIKHVSYTNNDMIMTLPITCSSFYSLTEEIRLLPYRIYSVAFIHGKKSKYKNIMKYREPITKTCTFIVKPDIQNDIYKLYYLHNSKEMYHNIACVPDYTTSVMMNGLFRNIKENICLDALEESDDEEEFENTDLDKFVDLDKSIKMECTYNNKFKMWTPIKPNNNNVVTKSELYKYEKK